jgi:hypothetical protein
MAHGEWFAVRTVFKWNRWKADGKNIFEERIVCFKAKDDQEAFSKAERESAQYAADNNMSQTHGDVVCYMQDGDDLIEGYEVWSELYESNLSLEQFYVQRYGKYEYHPD